MKCYKSAMQANICMQVKLRLYVWLVWWLKAQLVAFKETMSHPCYLKSDKETLKGMIADEMNDIIKYEGTKLLFFGIVDSLHRKP